MNKMTFREILEANNGEAVEVVVRTSDGLAVTASCWTDDEQILDTPAIFDVSADWEITSHSPVDSIDEIKIYDSIVSKVGGNWAYNAADLTFTQI